MGNDTFVPALKADTQGSSASKAPSGESDRAKLGGDANALIASLADADPRAVPRGRVGIPVRDMGENVVGEPMRISESSAGCRRAKPVGGVGGEADTRIERAVPVPGQDAGSCGRLAVSLAALLALVPAGCTSVNHPPAAVDDTATTPEDTPVTITVLANDTDPDGDALTVAAVTQSAHGSVTFGPTTVTYAPIASFDGADSFTYTAQDPAGATASAMVTVVIAAGPDGGLPPDPASVAPPLRVTSATIGLIFWIVTGLAMRPTNHERMLSRHV